MHISELKRMGANIKHRGSKIEITGVEELLVQRLWPILI